MKQKILYYLVFIGLLLGVFSLQMLDLKQHKERFYHHKVSISAQPVSPVEHLASHLPIIEIDTLDGKLIPLERGENEGGTRQQSVRGTVRLYDKLDEVNRVGDGARVETLAEIAYRGNSSRHFDKKSIKLRFVDKKGEDVEHTVAGMPKESEWVLHGPFLDRSLLRNYISYNLAGELMEYAPNVRYSEVMINGEYQGLYLIVESIEQGVHRIPVEKSDKRSLKTSYIAVWDRPHKAKNPVDNYVGYTYQADQSSLDIRYPNVRKITEAQKDFIQQDISKIERILYSYDLKQYGHYVDKNAFATYFVINEFFRNTDAGIFSTYLYKDLRDKMKIAVWDFNNAFDNHSDVEYDRAGFSMLEVPWFSMMIKDKEFIDLVVHKYHQLRKNLLSTKRLHDHIDKTVQFLGPAIQRNNDKWGYVFQLQKMDEHNYLQPYERNQASYEEAVHVVKAFIEDRGKWLDEHIETLYQYCAPSKNTNTLVDY
ncbi:CotH kinase family protein [Streptococcus suis]|uniref:CotH kinase family protein n=1 Tax=Streptococcus suis TaxID=1307 RepID=UPI00237DF1C9|nr:CotH kinase family protein [Streptococcus suis]MDE1693851.1 CotH kinase family protein [Streptococcus suis]